MGWNIPGRPKLKGQVGEDARGATALTPRVGSASWGTPGWIWIGSSAGAARVHTPSCCTPLAPSVLNSRGIMKTFSAEAWQPQTDSVEQASWQLWGRGETRDQESSPFPSLFFSNRLSDMCAPGKQTSKQNRHRGRHIERMNTCHALSPEQRQAANLDLSVVTTSVTHGGDEGR